MWEKTRQAWLGSTREADVELKFDVGERMRETDRQAHRRTSEQSILAWRWEAGWGRAGDAEPETGRKRRAQISD